MSNGLGSSQRYCTNCGAELRAGNSFCRSCGVAINSTDIPESISDAPTFESAPEKEHPHEAGPRPEEEVAESSPRNAYREYDLHRRFFQEAREGLVRFSERLKNLSTALGVPRSSDTERTRSSAPSKATTGYARAKAVNWFRSQSIVSKLIVVGLIILLFLTIIRPLALYAGIPSEAFIVISVIVVALLYREMTLSRWLSYTLLILSCAVVLGRLDAAIEAEDSYDADADLLLTTLQAGMVDGDQAIKDVEVTGSKATVIVSGVSDAYAESACRFVLGAAPELMMESESNDYAGITEVSVKRPLRLWNAASC